MGDRTDAPAAPPRQRGRRRAWTALAVAVSVVVLALMLAQAPGGLAADVLVRASPSWTLLAAGASLIPLAAMTGALLAVTPVPLAVPRVFVVQVATSFANALAPAGAGGVALNARFLQRRGVPTAEAVALVALVQLTSVAVTVVFLAVLLLATGEVAERVQALPLMALALGALAVAALAAASSRVPYVRRVVADRVVAPLSDAWPRLRATVSSPGRLCALVASHLAVTAGLALTLLCCVRAFEVELPFTAVLVAMLAGSAVGSAAPVPGGIGTVEAATAAALLAAGSGAADALSIALLFRLLTFWVRLPLGWLSLVWLRRSQAI